MPSPVITVTAQLIRDELVSLRRLAIDRRAASVRLPRVWRSALLHEPAAYRAPGAAPAARDKRYGGAT